MITINGKELRNLEDQVQFLTDKVAAHYGVDRVLAEFGIRIQGTLTRPPQAAGIVGTEYGDAYAVGTAAPYDIYIWTRNAGPNGTDGWLDVGPLGIVGPEGPQGQPGQPGKTGESTKWRTGAGSPNVLDSDKLNDLYLNTLSGNVWQLEAYAGGYRWVERGSIRGPQGPQGPQGKVGPEGPQGPQGDRGPTGDVGGFINIIGVVSNRDQMASPASLGNMTKAYLVGSAVPYDLYIQVGESSATAQWLNTGPLNVSTLVSVAGQYVNIWDADTKVNKITTGSGDRLYLRNSANQDASINLAGSPAASTVALRTTGGQLRVGTAVMDDAAVPYAQFKTAIDDLKAQLDAIAPSKNLFRSDFVSGTAAYDTVGGNMTEITIFGEGGFDIETNVPFKMICPGCVVGRTYTIKTTYVNGYSSGGDTVYGWNASMSLPNAFNINMDGEYATFTLTAAMMNQPITFYLSYYSGEWGPEQSTIIFKVMLNEGTTALPWEPAVK